MHGKVSLQLFPVVWIFLRSLDVICNETWVLTRSHKNSRIGISWTHSLLFWFITLFDSEMTILSNVCKPDNLESHNSLKFSFTIWGLHSNYVGCESFLESNFPDILACVRQTWKTQLILAISGWGFSFLLFNTQKDSVTHIHSLKVYAKRDFLFDEAYLKKTLKILISVLDWLFFNWCFTFSVIDYHLLICAQFLLLFI